MPSDKPKKPRRNRVKFPGLKKQYTTRIRQEYLDFDYLDQLNDEEKAWLNKFVEEELNTQFKNDGTDFNKTKEQRKKIYDRNNKQNSDLYGNLKNKDNKFKNKKLLNYDNISSEIENQLSKDLNPKSVENAIINFLDDQQINEMLEEYDLAMKDFNEEFSEPLELFQQLMPEPQEL